MGADPVKLGTILFTLVEPHRGHEVAYNRWYERDHFYAGCMVGPWCFAGRRFVATRACKDLRYPDESQMQVAIASMEELLKREGEMPQASVAPTAA